MISSFDDAGVYGKEFMDSALKSFASLQKGFESIASEASGFTKKTFEDGGAAIEKVFAANSIEKAFEVQTEYAKKAYEGLVAEATKFSELYAEVAKEAYKPFESIVAKTK